jgi:ATP-dependent DNA helicase 2 subunit 1
MDFEEDNLVQDVEDGNDFDYDIFGGDDEGGVQDLGSKKDAVLFLIDCRREIF